MKLRSHLGTKTMTAISELKMHLRDEDVRIGTKTCLKREFAARTTPIPAPPPPSEESPAAVIDPHVFA
jgi:hypothetical protein